MRPPPGTRTLARTWDGRPRSALLHLPPGPTPGPGWPVMVVLHGMGGSPVWTLQETGWNLFGDENGLALLVPEGLPLDPDAHASFWKNPPCWSDGGPRDDRRAVDDVGFLVSLLDELPTLAPLDARRVAVTGFSNGAAMAFRLAAEHSERVAAIAPVAGYCRLAAPRPTRPVPTVYIAGTHDPYVPVAGGPVKTLWGWTEERPPLTAMLGRWSEAMGGGTEPAVVGDGDGVRLESYPQPVGDMLAYLVEGLGHHWPGGRGNLSKRLFGPASGRLSANEVIWNFCRGVFVDQAGGAGVSAV